VHSPKLGKAEHGTPSGAGNFPVPSFRAIPTQWNLFEWLIDLTLFKKVVCQYFFLS